jgi:fido (protein-threonine AMPylation protein)
VATQIDFSRTATSNGRARQRVAGLFFWGLRMLDANWELINGADAHHIEQLNASNVINVLEALVTLLNSNTVALNQTIPFMPNQRALSELHRCATLFLLNNPGEYRNVPVCVKNTATGEVVYQAPPHEDVPRLVDEFIDELKSIWDTGDALDAAAFALWRVNWIHPFKNGNGRTARAFCYACLNARLSVILPGTTTVIDQIMTTRIDYEAAIRVADRAAVADPQARDLGLMKAYLDRLLQIQISSIP